MKPFFGPIYVDWFKAFPCPEPTVEELAEAKGARDVAKATLEAKIKSVSCALVGKNIWILKMIL